MKSLLRSLSNVGKKPPFNIPSGFQTYPDSLKEMMRIMDLPIPDMETLKHASEYLRFAENDSQGLVFSDGNSWYLSSQKNIFKATLPNVDLFNPPHFSDFWEMLEFHREHKEHTYIDWFNRKLCYKPYIIKKLTFADLNDVTDFTFDDDHYNHFGDIGHFNGLIFVPVEYKDKREAPLLLALSVDLELVGYSFLNGRESEGGNGYDHSAPWCAINPWNGLLYMSNTGKVSYLSVYNVSEFYQILPYRNKWGKHVTIGLLEDRFHFYMENGDPDMVDSIQGSVFSQDGRLYLARYKAEKYWIIWPFIKATRWRNYVQAYNSLTGNRIGISKEFDFKGVGDEIEGPAIGLEGVLHIAVTLNNVVYTDSFRIYAFKCFDS
jgi:hypothetical protein